MTRPAPPPRVGDVRLTRRRRTLPATALPLLAGCVTFAQPRSAAPPPGLGVHFNVASTTRPGDKAGRLLSLNCGSQCDLPGGGADLMFTHGRRGADSTASTWTLGVGLSDTFSPTVESYRRLGGPARRPYGAGARASWLGGRTTAQLFGRVDLAVGREARLLWNPGVLLYARRSQSGMPGGSVVALTQSLGAELGDAEWRIRPGVTWVLGRAVGESYGERGGPVTRGFAVFTLGFGHERGRR